MFGGLTTGPLPVYLKAEPERRAVEAAVAELENPVRVFMLLGIQQPRAGEIARHLRRRFPGVKFVLVGVGPRGTQPLGQIEEDQVVLRKRVSLLRGYEEYEDRIPLSDLKEGHLWIDGVGLVPIDARGDVDTEDESRRRGRKKRGGKGRKGR